MEVEARLREALGDLGPVLERHGFRLRRVTTGSGSGGPYAVARYARGLWEANVYYRNELEPGWYRHAWHELPHSALVPGDVRATEVPPHEYARQIEIYARVVLEGDWRAFWKRAGRAQREYHRRMSS